MMNGFTDYSKIMKELGSMNNKVAFNEMTTDDMFSYYSVTAGRYINIKWIYNEETANKIFERACELLADTDEIVNLRHTKEILPLKSFFAKLERKA